MRDQYKVLSEKYDLVYENKKILRTKELVDEYKQKLMFANTINDFFDVVKEIYVKHSTEINAHDFQKYLGQVIIEYFGELAQTYSNLPLVSLTSGEEIDISNVYYYYTYLTNAFLSCWNDVKYTINFAKHITPEELAKLVPSAGTKVYWPKWHYAIVTLNKIIKDYNDAKEHLRQKNKETEINLDI